MKSSFPIISQHGINLLRRIRVALGAIQIPIYQEGGGQRENARAILVGLMAPTVMVVLNASVFAVALPAIRDSFDAQADLLAWVVTGFTLSFVVFMPLYGRLGDGFGMRKPFLAGIILFLLGTAISALALDLRLLLLGRAIQGAGAAGITPLAIAMISEYFPARQRGKATHFGRVFDIRFLDLHFFTGNVLYQIVLKIDDFLDMLMTEKDRIEKNIFGNLFSSALDHNNSFFCPGDHDIDIAFFQFCGFRIDNKFFINASHTDSPDRSEKRYLGNHHGR